MGDQQFRDAEAWLAERGVRRDPLRVPLEPPDAPRDGGEGDAGGAAAAGGGASPTPVTTQPPAPPHVAEAAPASDTGSAQAPPVSAREAARLAASSADETLRQADEALGATPGSTEPRLEDDVADAVAFVRRSTANTPQTEGRLAQKLLDRGWSSGVVEEALQRCRRSGLVDDAAMAAALVEEGRRKGHAPRRLRNDLRRRGLDETIIERALEPTRAEDPEAAAFAVARDKASRLTGVEAETAFRRIVGHLARRGHPEALARKVARAAVFDARDPQRTAGH